MSEWMDRFPIKHIGETASERYDAAARRTQEALDDYYAKTYEAVFGHLKELPPHLEGAFRAFSASQQPRILAARLWDYTDMPDSQVADETGVDVEILRYALGRRRQRAPSTDRKPDLPAPHKQAFLDFIVDEDRIRTAYSAWKTSCLTDQDAADRANISVEVLRYVFGQRQ